MSKNHWWFVAPLALLLVAAADYPNAIYDPTTPATKRNTEFNQTEQNQVIDEIGAIETALGANFEQRGVSNLLSNGSVEVWTAGTSVAPDSWTLSGTGAAVARQSDGQDGSYSAQITAGTATSKLSQDALATISASVNARLRGAWAVMTARVKTSTATACRLEIDDGVGQTQSSYHTGGGSWELLTVERSLDASATKLTGNLRNEKTDSASTCRFDSVMLLEGRFVQRAFLPMPLTTTSPTGQTPVGVTRTISTTSPVTGGGDLSADRTIALDTLPTGHLVAAGTGSGTATLVGVMHVDTTAGCTIADTNETTLITYSLPANTLSANGKGIRVTTWGTFAANANNKTLKLYFGATSISSGVLAINNSPWVADYMAIRTGAATQALAGHSLNTTTGATYPKVASPTETLSGAVTIKVTGTNGTASANDICATAMVVEILN